MTLPRVLVLALVAPVLLAGCAEEAPPSTGTPTPSTPATGTPTTPTSPTGTASACTSTLDAANTAANPVWVLETSLGEIRVTLFCDKAPITAQNIVKLTESGFYDGTKFHRVIEGFMNQGGDPLSKDEAHAAHWGTGDAGYDIQDEFACADGTTDSRMNDPQYPGRPPRESPHQACEGALALKHDGAGVASMANSGPNSGSSQFFLTATATPHLDGAHPIFGRAIDEDSLATIREINRVPTDANDRPTTPVVLDRATIEW